MYYFDNAATSLIKPAEVRAEVMRAMKEFTANPGRSGHFLSQKVAEKIFDVRENIKDFLGAKDCDVIFTKNCTEALNLALFGFLKSGDHVITTCYEHNSVLRPLENLKQNGVEVTVLDCNLDTFPEELKKAIKSNTKLVITTYCSNVTGEVCNVNSVAKICHENNIVYLVDGAQACGHIKIDIEKSGIDMFAFAGHKGLLSLTGVGGLIVRPKIKLKPIILGGTGTDSESLVQPIDTIEAFESGTLPTISILSLGASVKFLKKNQKKILEKEKELNLYLYSKLKNLKFLKLYSTDKSLNVYSFNIGEMDSMLVADKLNFEYNICVRSGLHCAPLIHKKLGTLNQGAVRVSLDYCNTKEEIDQIIKALIEINAQSAN